MLYSRWSDLDLGPYFDVRFDFFGLSNYSEVSCKKIGREAYDMKLRPFWGLFRGSDHPIGLEFYVRFGVFVLHRGQRYYSESFVHEAHDMKLRTFWGSFWGHFAPKEPESADLTKISLHYIVKATI